MNTIESVEKRERRLMRERRKYESFRQKALLYRDFKWKWAADVCSLRTLAATWDSIRRVAGYAIGVGWIPDVMTAWQVFDFVLKLPDGQERIGKAIDTTLSCWAIALEIGEKQE